MEYNPDAITNAISLTKDWEEIPEIYQFGPKPGFPDAGLSRSIDETTTFTWGEYPLKEHQFYSVSIVRAGSPNSEACIHIQVRVPYVELKPEEKGCTRGPYYWGVGIATELAQIDEAKILQGQGGEAVWRDDSVFDERFPLGLSDNAPSGGPRRVSSDKGDPGEGDPITP